MTNTESGKQLRRTPLYEVHQGLGAKIVEFGGWEMPVYYTGINEEHLAVCRAAGLFDVSHMGEFEIQGNDAPEAVQYLTTNDAARLNPGQVQYSLLCNERGGVVDDLTVFRLALDRFLLCVNAANTAKDLDWLQAHWRWRARLTDRSAETALLAVQGPASEPIVQKLTTARLDTVSYYEFVVTEISGVHTIVSRTGYTGEDGFELYFHRDQARDLWEEITRTGVPLGLRPCGLGARDTLRIEMRYALYGSDLDDSTTPLEAGLGWLVKPDKGDFLGREALEQQKNEGIRRKLIAFELLERAVPRSHYPIFCREKMVGRVTSGTFSPCLQEGIGMGYVDAAKVNDELEIDIRGKRVKARRVNAPFRPSRVKKQ